MSLSLNIGLLVEIDLGLREITSRLLPATSDEGAGRSLERYMRIPVLIATRSAPEAVSPTLISPVGFAPHGSRTPNFPDWLKPTLSSHCNDSIEWEQST